MRSVRAVLVVSCLGFALASGLGINTYFPRDSSGSQSTNWRDRHEPGDDIIERGWIPWPPYPPFNAVNDVEERRFVSVLPPYWRRHSPPRDDTRVNNIPYSNIIDDAPMTWNILKIDDRESTFEPVRPPHWRRHQYPTAPVHSTLPLVRNLVENWFPHDFPPGRLGSVEKAVVRIPLERRENPLRRPPQVWYPSPSRRDNDYPLADINDPPINYGEGVQRAGFIG